MLSYDLSSSLVKKIDLYEKLNVYLRSKGVEPFKQGQRIFYASLVNVIELDVKQRGPEKQRYIINIKDMRPKLESPYKKEMDLLDSINVDGV